MNIETFRAVVRPIINFIFIGVTASSFYLPEVEVPTVWMIMTLVCGAEWVSERAIMKYKELFNLNKKD